MSESDNHASSWEKGYRSAIHDLSQLPPNQTADQAVKELWWKLDRMLRAWRDASQ